MQRGAARYPAAVLNATGRQSRTRPNLAALLNPTEQGGNTRRHATWRRNSARPNRSIAAIPHAGRTGQGGNALRIRSLAEPYSTLAANLNPDHTK